MRIVVTVWKLCRALKVWVLIFDVSLSRVGMIAVEGNDEGEKTEECEEQEETYFNSMDKLWYQTHPRNV